MFSLENQRGPSYKTLPVSGATGLKHCPGELRMEFLVLRGNNDFILALDIQTEYLTKNRICTIT